MPEEGLPSVKAKESGICEASGDLYVVFQVLYRFLVPRTPMGGSHLKTSGPRFRIFRKTSERGCWNVGDGKLEMFGGKDDVLLTATSLKTTMMSSVEERRRR
eukprot:scaffold1803_cov92-Amphora_coffeaeformis.AAC.39